MEKILHPKSESRDSCQLYCGDEIMVKICKETNIKLIDMSLPENEDHIEANGIESYMNSSFSVVDEIHLGIYENKEYRFISFFHELGHIITLPNYLGHYNTKFEYEIAAWYSGLEYARNLGIHFSDEALEWGYNQALTYIGYNEREIIRWEVNHSE